MAQSQNIPQLGYPCLATGESTVSLVGLQYASSDKNDTAYALQSFTFPKPSNRIVTNAAHINFTLTQHLKPYTVRPLATSRMICSFDKASGTFLYIFNENVYIENSQNPALATEEPIPSWDPARNQVPQVVWPKSEGQGQFQWLGVNNGNWTMFDIDATNGVSTPTPAPVPADIPSNGIFSIIRESAGSFLVVYNKASNTTAARFTLGAPTSTPVTMASDDIGFIGFSAVSHAQDATVDYFFGTQGSWSFTAAAKLNSSSIEMISTRELPKDANGPVPQLFGYGAATVFDTSRALVYGGQSDAANNSWTFGLTAVITDAGYRFNNYTVFGGPKASSSSPSNWGNFAIYTPPAAPVPEEKSGLSTPAIIGIAVGAVALVMLVGFLAIFHRRNKKIEARAREQEGLGLAVRDLHAKGGEGMGMYQPPFASTHSLLNSEANTTPRGQNSISTERPAENMTLRVPIVRYAGQDVAQSVPHAPLGAVVLSQYRLGQTAVNTKMVVIQLGENVDTAESVTLKWVRDEIVWQREAAMLNHIVNPAKIISLHQTMIIPAALEWRHILVLDAHDSTLDFMLSTHQHRLLSRADQRAVAKALLGGLVWCHEKDVIHLSICTGSLVMNEEGQWVIWSFGGARFLNEAVGPRQGSLIGQENGTVERNLAPELLSARRENRLDSSLAAPSMDAWAAGCVLFEVLTGQPLFRTEEAADQAATGRFTAWKDRLVDIPDLNERRVVEQLLVLDPNSRSSLNQAEHQFV
ncbi:Cyclin-dependent kinase 12 [Lobosporangium transversale]|uniref:[RNA-polymerase]-subunit kinase n=1 Tax=Lobosporangium transversale TaxID=64571 RepID=A0A1Y2GMY8_9FUNG|nr:kinase-like domain-containing protein [Lobosporangium transversale]KAF9916669.1 Cyclin-dependent kinase 12 [Lobosporangium transversale]ORZ16058.1 kinase-like domain-containing protein [Lobosporangium transversale]|eukprot:XP_021881405.1 kinase-like domain-containing protein [Lobosporangium transversale]